MKFTHASSPPLQRAQVHCGNSQLTQPSTSGLAPVLSERLSDLAEIRHAFFTRPGGVSTGVYEGLNVGIGSDDDPKRVQKNREIASTWLGETPGRLVTLYQVHSPDVLIVDTPFGDERPKADGLATNTPGLILGVLTADCGPVLFADPQNGVIGACHAGWKGATGGVLESTISAMEKLGSDRKNITAVLGPTISQINYEVGPEFTDRLCDLDADNTVWLTNSPNEGHSMFDLPGYIVNRLSQAGVHANWTGQCTYADERNFYSYRRKTHRAEPDYGRQLSAICLKN